MKLILLLVVAAAGVQAGCAVVGATRAPAAVSSDAAVGSPSASDAQCSFLDRGPYSAGQVARIHWLRDNGASLSQVMREVGGTRLDIKRVELSDKARTRRGQVRVCGTSHAPELVTQLAADVR
jgi:hypothetical protein